MQLGGREDSAIETNVNYEIKCCLCSSSNLCLYIGETSRNVYTRGLEHIAMARKEDEVSFIHKHMYEYHRGMKEEIIARVSHSNKDYLSRQVREGVQIRRSGGRLMNSKSEWFQPPLFQIRNELVNS